MFDHKKQRKSALGGRFSYGGKVTEEVNPFAENGSQHIILQTADICVLFKFNLN